MGIKDLNGFLKENAPEALSVKHFSELSGKTLAVDTSIYFYKFLYKNERFLESFFNQIAHLRQYNITPIYVFDGRPPVEKFEEINVRKARKQTIKNEIATIKNEIEALKNVGENENNDMEEKKKQIMVMNFKLAKAKKKLIYVTPENIKELKYMLDLMNIQFIQANGEADSVCSKLNSNGIVDMVLSDDMDLLVTGTKILLRDYCLGHNKITVYNTDTILDKLELNSDQWVDFCILCGCDYSKRIRGMGPNNSFKYIKECGNIETIVSNYVGADKKFKDLPNNFNYGNARELMKHCKHYEDSYNNLNVTLEPLFGNQLENISKFIKKSSLLSDVKIRNRLRSIYGIEN
jgi:flap endonuclease-1